MKGTSVMSDAVCDANCCDVVVKIGHLEALVETLRNDLGGLYDSVISLAIDHREMALRAAEGPLRADAEEKG